jgi:hypothetical protein
MSGYVVANESCQNGPFPIASEIGGVIEGKVVEMEANTLVLEKTTEKSPEFTCLAKAKILQGIFQRGTVKRDYIEAAVSLEGITTSVRLVPNTKNH